MAQSRNPSLRADITRVAPEVVARAATFPSSILADVNGRRGALDGRIAAVCPDCRMAGPAFTIDVARAGDNLMIHTALALAQPGDILVIDGKADRTVALMGSIMMNTARQIGLGGVVVDAAVRDIDELRALGFPVYAVGTNPNGPTKFVPGLINAPISCGGVAVQPGDLVVGDADGVVVIERERAEALLPLAAAKVADERARLEDIAAKRNLRQGWLEPALRAAGLLKEGETL